MSKNNSSISEESWKSELTIRRQLQNLVLAKEITEESPIFFGAGYYDYYAPLVLERLTGQLLDSIQQVTSSSEKAQEVFQVISESEAVISRLTQMDFTNVSFYAQGSPLVKACLIATEETQRRKIYIPETLNPDSRQIITAYSHSGHFEPASIPTNNGTSDTEALKSLLNDDDSQPAGIVIQYPNFYGNLEQVSKIVDIAKKIGALTIMFVDPIALTMLKTPGEWDIDLVVGNFRSFTPKINNDLPNLGFISASKDIAHYFPKRSFETKNNAQVSSMICSLAELGSALRSLVYLTFTDPLVLKRTIEVSHRAARYARSELLKSGFAFHHDSPYLREFAVKVDDPKGMNQYLLKLGIVGGVELQDGLLLAFTDKQKREEIDELVFLMKDYQFKDITNHLQSQNN